MEEWAPTLASSVVLLFVAWFLKNSTKDMEDRLSKSINDLKADVHRLREDLKADVNSVREDLKSHEAKCDERNRRNDMAMGALIGQITGKIPTE